MSKVVKSFWDELITIFCSCPGCEDKLVVTAEKKFYNNDNFYFEIVYEDPCNLWQRIKTAWRYIRGYRELNLSFDALLLDTEQAEELAKALIERVNQYKKESKKTLFRLEQELREKIKENRALKKTLAEINLEKICSKRRKI